MRQMPDAGLGLQAFGDVAFDRDIVRDHAFGVAHRRDRGLLLVQGAILVRPVSVPCHTGPLAMAFCTAR